jgi:hypothetical protein
MHKDCHLCNPTSLSLSYQNSKTLKSAPQLDASINRYYHRLQLTTPQTAKCGQNNAYIFIMLAANISWIRVNRVKH